MGKKLSVITLITHFVLLSLVMALPAAQLVDHYGTPVSTDTGSTTCLTCHDGSGVAPTVSSCTTNCNFFDSHPIDKDYPPPGKEEEFAPLSVLADAGVMLPNGKISCVSCHDLALSGQYHIPGGLPRSSLCFLCHIK